jgi:cytochrome c-type biogenesis protein
MQDTVSPPARWPSRILAAAAVVTGVVLVVGLLLVLARLAAPSDSVGANVMALAPAAFLAGVLSFLSPCTLPLLPAYFAFRFQTGKQNVLLMTITFFLGLATTLTLLGASATALSQVLFQYLPQITFVGGVVIIGLGVMSLIGKGFAGPQLQARPGATLVGSYLYGATFALGWTACVGPILGAILTLLATQGAAIAQGALLAFIYALGLGAPLIIVATFFDQVGRGTRTWDMLKGRGFTVNVGSMALDLHTTSVLSGLLLIAMGYLLASGQLALMTQMASGSDLSQWVIEMEARLGPWLGLH